GEGRIEKEATVMLNITGAGEKRFKAEHDVVRLEPERIFPLNVDAETVVAAVEAMFPEVE
ncbi:MAG: cysteate synthase, partial [Alistipes sp.]|nr:cysteate synthase [Alistipes sp.]